MNVNNAPPYFDDEWSATQPVQLYFNEEEVEYIFPSVQDDNDDEVTITVNMEEIDQIAVWDESKHRLIFNLEEDT